MPVRLYFMCTAVCSSTIQRFVSLLHGGWRNLEQPSKTQHLNIPSWSRICSLDKSCTPTRCRFASSFFCSSTGLCWSDFPIYFPMGALTGAPCSYPQPTAPSGCQLYTVQELPLCLISQQLRNTAIWTGYVEKKKKKKNWKEKDFLLNYSPPSP